MLNVLRHKGVSRKVLWVVAVIIILSFGVFGTASQLDRANSAGKMYGKDVSFTDFQRAYLDSRDQAIIMYGDRFFKMGNMLDLERETWNRLILLKEAKRRGIKATDQEVVEFIATLPFFQRDGKFDQRTYESIVINRSIFERKPKEFEEGIRGSLTIKKLFEVAAPEAPITEEELKKEYVRRNEKIKLSYVLFSPNDFTKNVTATDDEAKAFYNSHKEMFVEAPMVNLEYIHLLFPEKATDEQKKAIKKQAEEAAKTFTGKDVKESGFFTQAQPLLTFAWSPEFVDKIFTMKVGEKSPALETPDGYQIVRLKDRKEAQTPEFASIAARVKEAVINEKALAAASSKADESLKSIREAIKTKSFKDAAAGLKIDETNAFARGEYINAPGLVAEFQQESLSLNESNKLSGIVRTSQGPAILYLSSTETIDDKKYAEDKEDFKQMLSAQRRNQAIMQLTTKLKMDANVQSDVKSKARYR